MFFFDKLYSPAKRTLVFFLFTNQLLHLRTQRCSEAIETLKNSGQLSSKDTRSIPVIACDQYLKNGIDHVLTGMTKEKYVEELRDLF